VKLKFKYIEKIFSERKEHQFNFTNLVKQLISFIFGVIVIFFFVQAAFVYLIGVDTSSSTPATTPDTNKKESFFSY